MSPCIAATNGIPANRYGFHSGNSPCVRRYSAANWRNGKPAMYWSLFALTRKRPASAGHPSARVASA
jgi:hypothetical protein